MDKYIAIKYMNEAEHYPIQKLCAAVHVARSAYYKWLHRTPSHSQQINEQLVEWIKQHYEERNGILGYRQMTVVINREHDVHFNKKRIYRLMQILHLKSVTRVKKNTYIPSTPQFTAENILNRDFHADKPNEKWLTDVGMIQSMSRVGRCIDNGPMEGWWGILKSEMYYLRKFTDKTKLISAIEEYITYYNTRRYQIKLSSMTPMEYHEAYAA